MEHNQGLLLSELNLHKKNFLALQKEVTMMNKKMAENVSTDKKDQATNQLSED